MKATRRAGARAAARPAPARHPARDLWLSLLALGLLLLARVQLETVHGTWVWSLDTLRFTRGLTGPLLGLALVLVMLPPLARRLLPALEALGGLIERRAWIAALALAVLSAALVWALPDRTGWMGDFAVRQGTLEKVDVHAAAWFPQASPLDLALHHRLPRALAAATGVPPASAARAIGAFETALLAAFAVAFARASGVTGAPAALLAIAALAGPQLGLFTGYGKSFTEVVMATLLASAAALAMLRGRRWDLALAAALALAVFAHRSGFVLVPAAALAWILAGRAEPRRWRDPRVVAAVVLALAALAVAAAGALPTLRSVDVAAHLTPHEPGTGGAWWKGVFAGTRPLDFANVVLGLPPLLLASLASLAVLARQRERRDALLFFATLLGCWTAGMLAVHPAQGYMRDYDDIAAFVTALGVAAAWAIGTRAADDPPGRWIAVPAVATALVATTLWLLVPADPAAGLARVHAFVTEPPARAPDQLAASWEFLGMRATAEQRWPDAAEALAAASRLAPAPTTLREWALAELQMGRPEKAVEIYHTLLARDPRNVMGWYSLAAVSTQVGDYPGAASALRSLLAIAPDDTAARENLSLIEQAHPELRVSPRH